MSQIVNKIIDAIIAQISLYNLELLQRYPDDLLKHDRAMLERNALPGSKFAYMVGHGHSHIAKLGVHPEFNECPTYWTRLANDDRFYVIDISRDGQHFTMKELTREFFPTLASTAIPYRRVGNPNAFWLYKGDTRVGSCSIEYKGVNGARHSYHASLAAIAGTSERDKLVLEDWACSAANHMAGSLFRDLGFTWQPAIELPQSERGTALAAV
jgi:hypothetical protein